MSGLYEGLFVMRDEETGSQWLHYTGECIQGPMAGRFLGMYDTNVVLWPAFRERNPSAQVISDSPSWFRRLLGRLDRGRQAPSFFRLPPWFTRTMHARAPSSLPDTEFGLGVVLGQRSLLGGVTARATKFYPYARLRGAGLVQETLASTPVLVRWDARADAAVAFLATLGERAPTFRLEGASLVDDRGNRYGMDGAVLEGPEQGGKLSVLPAIATRWYGFHQSYPDAAVFSPEA